MQMGLVETLHSLLTRLPHVSKEVVLGILAHLASLRQNRAEMVSCGVPLLLCELVEQSMPETVLLQVLVLFESLLFDGW
jgi:hypothetical protein